MTTEPAARPTPALKRERQMAMYRRALRTLPGRHELELPGVGRRHDLHRPGQGRDGLGHRRERVHRPPDGLRTGDPRPRRRPGRRPRQRADAQGRQLLAHERGRGPRDGAHLRDDRLGQEGAHDRLRDRGDDARDADRPGLHGPDEDRQVRGPVPRRPRLRADQRHPGRHERARRQREPGRAGLGSGDPGSCRRDDHPGPLQRARRPAPDLRARRRRHRRDHHRAGPRQRPGDPAPAGLPRGDPGPDDGVRLGPHLRRGQDRLPVRPRRRRRVLRRDPRPCHVRQGDRQRLPGRGVRWQRRGHERPARTTSATAGRTPATGSPRPPRSRR